MTVDGKMEEGQTTKMTTSASDDGGQNCSFKEEDMYSNPVELKPEF